MVVHTRVPPDELGGVKLVNVNYVADLHRRILSATR
jgi:hypothetical protein